MDFPIVDLMDPNACYQFLVRTLLVLDHTGDGSIFYTDE
jgi:hypothetical protein